MKMREFEAMLTGGHPNSLGRTVEVVDAVLANPGQFRALFDCYGSSDPVVRLRVSSAMKRIEAENRDLLLPYVDKFIDEIGVLDQASAQWTLAQLFDRMVDDLSTDQKKRAEALMKKNLAEHNDWIVLNTTMETLGRWAKDDKALSRWLQPHLKRLSKDPRKSVAKRAAKTLASVNQA